MGTNDQTLMNPAFRPTRHRMRWQLQIRDIRLGLRFADELKLFHVSRDADNLSRPFLRRGIEGDLTSDGIFVGPELSRHRFVNHDHRRRCLRILLGDAAASHDRNAHQLKITRTDTIQDDGWLLCRKIRTPAYNREARESMLGVIGERKPVHQSRTLDAGYFSNPIQQLPAE